MRSSKRALKPSKSEYPLRNHPNKIMLSKIIPMDGVGSEFKKKIDAWVEAKIDASEMELYMFRKATESVHKRRSNEVCSLT